MQSYAARALVVIVMAGSSLVLAPPADARLTWIVRNDSGSVGTPPGSDQPCDQAAGHGNGASAERLDNGACWIVLPDAAAEHVNPVAVEPWVDTPARQGRQGGRK